LNAARKLQLKFDLLSKLFGYLICFDNLGLDVCLDLQNESFLLFFVVLVLAFFLLDGFLLLNSLLIAGFFTLHLHLLKLVSLLSLLFLFDHPLFVVSFLSLHL